MDNLRTVYSIGVRFAGPGIGRVAYNAAMGLFEHNMLDRLIVSTRNRSEIPESKITRLWIKAVFSRLAERLHFPEDMANYLSDGLYSRLSSNFLPVCDLYHGWNSFALHSIFTARKSGMPSIVERASSHPYTQYKLQQEESVRWGVPFDVSGWNARQSARAARELVEADYITVPSSFVYDSFKDQGFEENKLVLIPFGVDLNHFRPSAEKNNKIFRVLFVGQLSFRKGILDLLDAWQQLDLPNTELLLVGKSENLIKPFLKDVHRHCGFSEVGFVQDPVSLFQSASIFVFPSIEEGSALVTYEAMASGLPVITTKNSGSVVRDGKDGFIVPIRSPKLIAEKITMLYKDTELQREMGLSARRQIEDYSWEHYRSNLVGAYKTIIRQT